MNALKEELIKRAIKRYGDIKPCVGKKSIYECFTFEEGILMFWYNVKDNGLNSTHSEYVAVNGC